MENLNQHWTSRSIADFVHRISSDFIAQLETKIEQEPIERKALAQKLGVTPGRVSQVLNNPGNLTIAKIVQYARALGMKVAIVAYNDDDPSNRLGPISSEVFQRCWHRMGRPHDLFSLSESPKVPIHRVSPIRQMFYRPRILKTPSSSALLDVHFELTQQQKLPEAGAPVAQERYA